MRMSSTLIHNNIVSSLNKTSELVNKYNSQLLSGKKVQKIEAARCGIWRRKNTGNGDTAFPGLHLSSSGTAKKIKTGNCSNARTVVC